MQRSIEYEYSPSGRLFVPKEDPWNKNWGTVTFKMEDFDLSRVYSPYHPLVVNKIGHIV